MPNVHSKPIWIGIGSVGIAIFLAIISRILCTRFCRNRNKQDELDKTNTILNQPLHPPPSIDQVSTYELQETSHLKGRQEILLESMFDFTDEIRLGEGNFGVVSKVKIKCRSLMVKTQNRFVAIKKLKNIASEKDKMCLKEEILIMKKISWHPCLVNIIGSIPVSCGEEWLVIEFCNLGDLKRYMKNHRDFLISCNEDGDMKSRWLLRWAYEISVGMKYLGEAHILHGDLAARNILVQSHPVLGECPVSKIADFGLSKTFYTYPHNLKEAPRGTPFPWKWMGYEYISDNKIGLKSDVWSFGVLFWELLDMGETAPYLEFHKLDQDFKESLERREFLQCPKKIQQVQHWVPHSPEKLFERISACCFQLVPEKRSSFKTIGETIAANFSEKEIQHYQQFHSEFSVLSIAESMCQEDECT